MTQPAAPSPAIAPPGRGRYLLAIVIFLAGMAGMAVFLTTRLMAMQDGLNRFLVPGEQVLALEPGTYTIFHETHGFFDGKLYASPALGGLIVTVTGPGGETVPIAPAGSGRYNFGEHTGYAVFDFTTPSAGNYAVSGRYDDGAPTPQVVLAVGSGFMSSLLGTIFGALGIAFAGAIIAAVLIIHTLIKRRRAGLRF